MTLGQGETSYAALTHPTRRPPLFRVIGLATTLSILSAQGPLDASTAKTTAQSPLPEDPFKAPKEMEEYFRQVAVPGFMPQRLQSLLTATFGPKDRGYLAMEYDNASTRTVAEVWRDRKANCLSLTAFYVAAAEAIGIRIQYAEALNTNRWTRVNGIIRKERHVVALAARQMGGEDLVADFLPSMRRRVGFYQVRTLSKLTFLALFHANRAVESLDLDDMKAAMAHADLAVATDPLNSTSWNIRGVLCQRQDLVDEAEACFRKAIALDKRDVAALGNLESLLRRSGRMEESTRVRAYSHEIRKRDPYFQFFLAEEALAERKHDESEKYVKAAIRLHKEEPEFHLLKARILLEKGQVDAAKTAIDEAQKWASPAEKARYANKADAIRRQQESLEPKK